MNPKVTLYLVVHGEAYERYAQQLLKDAAKHFLPGESETVVLPGRPGANGDNWPHVSATRYRVALDNLDKLRGDWIFQIDADCRILNPVGDEILADGVTVTTHPGFPPGTDPDECPYERREESTAYVPFGAGGRYHPGAFVGGTRKAFTELAGYLADAVDRDIRNGVHAVWYEESHLNRYLLDHPPALILDKRYCWWAYQWGPDPARQGARIMHLDKTPAEFASRG